MRTAKRVASVLFMVLAAPALAHGRQLGTIAGAVRDTSGGVLPGVTVEVASNALIEIMTLPRNGGTVRSRTGARALSAVPAAKS